MAAAALVYDTKCLDHDNGSMLLNRQAREWLDFPHAESPTRIANAYQVLDRAGVAAHLEHVAAREAAIEELELVHDRDYIDSIRVACQRGEYAWVGPEARVGPGSWTPSLLATGGLLAATDYAYAGEGRSAYVLARPPGHHSSQRQAMGFCLFNSVAVAARYAQRTKEVERVAIVDWDVHHGNGTQACFYEDPSVLFISLHQDGLYPVNSGLLSEHGAAEGEGFTVNIPLPPGTGDAGYQHAFEELVVPIVTQFDPQLILISSGQDAAASDPLGRMSVTTEGFRAMTAALKLLADTEDRRRLIAFQEGGYSPEHMPFCVLATVETLAGLQPLFDKDPVELDVPPSLGDPERAAVAASVAAHAPWWRN
jgi:acetoin utilization deacetylase AcuC-like enzyme